ncbi:MAG: phosphate/phosphite/phosphonate ABC transporter substrate-binding protein [Nitrosarchaeum sp.]|jgi:phosphonate transport system substrate-binding protein|uniref:phosphate/phosphite/phosphonate ABC transporter substrate-binding protein n=1 Tax=Nitrosarchaeum sp. TaxID=2026886 RepID=UPI002DF1EA1F|nr:phosphate/phosphite/phosphonate ABC transporter substrate-binding protein [Nitrosarchaeum sp.]
MNKFYVLIPIILIAGIGIGYGVFVTTDNNVDTTAKKVITLAIQPTAQASDIESQANELEQYLEQETDYDIQIYVPTSYAGVVEALRFGKADVAFMSAWPAYLAVEKAGATLEIAEVREVVIGDTLTAETFYYSYWVVPKDSPYNTLEDLRGKRAAFSSPLSTSGYVTPMKTMVETGLITVEKGKEVDPKSYFSDVVFAGGYSQAWEALKSNKVDVSIIAGDVSEKLYREVRENTKVIHEQGPIPSHGVVFSKEMDSNAKMEIKRAMLKMGNDDSTKQIMRKLVSAIFVGFEETTAEKHLENLQSALEMTGLKYTEKV